MISSFGADGRADTSPRGDPPGFVAVLDERSPLIPDRPGNNQIDSMQNIVAHPQVGLLFLVPGMTETLRVSGTAEIVTDAELLAPLSVGGKPPLSGLRVTVEEAFLHCGRALIRSRLWDPEVQIERTRFPTYGQVLADQIKGANAAEIMPPKTRRIATGSIEQGRTVVHRQSAGRRRSRCRCPEYLPAQSAVLHHPADFAPH